MKSFNIRTSFYLLPIFFFVLALSPNMAGDRIGLVLLSVYLLLVPGANYFTVRFRKLIRSNNRFEYSIRDLIALIIILGTFYIGGRISWEYCLMQVLFIIIVAVEGKNKEERLGLYWYLGNIFYGFIFYSLIYLGLNQYSFSILFGLSNLAPAFLVGIIIITTFYIDKLDRNADVAAITSNKLSLALQFLLFQVLTFSTYFYLTTELKYAIYYVLAIAIPILFVGSIKIRLEKSGPKNNPHILTTTLWLLPVCQTIFFLFYFLDSTQVWQAITGGY